MRFLNGLFGLLLVGVMACTGLGDQYLDNWAIIQDVQDKQDERVEDEEEVRGTYAAALQDEWDCESLLTQIAAALAGPHFDPNYNGDPAMPNAKQAFNDRRAAYYVSLGTLHSSRVSSAAAFESWNSSHTAAGNQATLDFWDNKNQPQASQADLDAVTAGLPTLNSLIESNIDTIAGYQIDATGIACTAAALEFDLQTLLDEINAF